MSDRGAFSRRIVATYGSAIEVVAFALLAYVPFLRSSPGRVVADTKQALYLDPARFLARTPYMWDPHIGAGTVPHQQIGYLFPMGPYYWLMDKVGVPDWVAQRLWLGTISLFAALGARWLFRMLGTRRAGALAGALVYMLTPYQLAFTARISVLLLPWAALPWLTGLVMRAVRRGGWRDPAIVALIVLFIGSVNASALLLAAIGPLLWVVMELCRGREAARAALLASARIAVLTLGVSMWWVIGLRTQGAYGLPVLQLTENVRTVATASLPNDVLRGIGNWFFYGKDRLGYSIDQANDYAHDHLTIALSYLVPALALFAAMVLRWKHRAYFALLVVVGTVFAVGAWPYDDPTPYGRVWRSVANNWSPTLALRNSPRIVPLVVLGLAGILAAAIGALRRRAEVVAALVVGALAFAAFMPVWKTGYLSAGVERPSDVPSYWTDAIAQLQREGNSTRVLEIPGANFAAYRWGNAVEPITPSLMDRPYIAREVLPYGTPPSVNLLDAFDRRIQLGIFEPASLAAMARRFDAGTVVLRSDLAWDRQGSPRPRPLWALLTEPLVKGVQQPKAYGAAGENVGPPAFETTDLVNARDTKDPPPVVLFDVDQPVPIVHTAPAEGTVVLAGDGDGVVDASAAGLLDGRQLVLQLPAVDDATLRRALDSGASLVLTDTNRRRFRNFFSSIRETASATERAGQTTTDPNGYEFRLEPFPGATDASRTVVEQRGGLVDATADGGASRPEDRAVHAFDGDVRTSWRVGGADPTREHITLRPDHATNAGSVNFEQPLDGPRDRVITKVRLRFDDGSTVDADLGPQSFTDAGQTVKFAPRRFSRVEVDIVATSTPPFDPELANAVGFAEIRIGGVQVEETVRLPVDLARRVGTASAGHPIDVVMTRLRIDPSDTVHQDEELALDRVFTLGDARDLALTGTARVNPNAGDAALDTVMGTHTPGWTFSASSHLPAVDARASRAFDDDPQTAWTSALAPADGQWIEASSTKAVTVDQVGLTFVADGRHSVPMRMALVADGKRVRTLVVPAIADSRDAGGTASVTIPFAPVTAKSFQIVAESVRHPAPEFTGGNAGIAPIGIADVRLPHVPVALSNTQPSTIDSGCRDDLLRVDGHPYPIRFTGRASDARRGYTITACGDFRFPASTAGEHHVVAAKGLDTAIDVDRLVLSTQRVAVRGTPITVSGATVRRSTVDATSADVTVRTDGKPFWLVFGESHNDGWHASASDGARLGERQLVDGYANGWYVQPSQAGTITISLRWTPQKVVWGGFAVSLVAIVVCLALLVFARRRAAAGGADAFADAPQWWWGTREHAQASWRATIAFAVAAAAVTFVFARPWIAAVAALAAVLLARWPVARVVAFVATPVVLLVSRGVDRPEFGWLALALFAVTIAADRVRGQGAAPDYGRGRMIDPHDVTPAP